jgi:prevent-host-death family protein
MQRISIREIRNQLGKLDTLIEKEHELIITRHNKPVARVLPIKEKRIKPSHKALRDRLPDQEVSSDLLQRDDREGR